MKIKFAAVAVALILLGIINSAQATLTTIGTADYDLDGNGIIGNGETFNLIWDDDNNGNSLVWLDYRRSSHSNTWDAANTWVAGLDGALRITWNLGVTVNWTDPGWRLPSAGANPQRGFNQTTSEMGHLWYDELGLSGSVTTTQLNASNFDALFDSYYTTYSTS